jgi:hypothetical protein
VSVSNNFPGNTDAVPSLVSCDHQREVSPGKPESILNGKKAFLKLVRYEKMRPWIR